MQHDPATPDYSAASLVNTLEIRNIPVAELVGFSGPRLVSQGFERQILPRNDDERSSGNSRGALKLDPGAFRRGQPHTG